MAININRWSPDTCSCVVEYSWDDSVPAEQRVHKLHRIVTACPEHPADAHAVGTDMTEVHLQVKNTHKNVAIKTAIEALGIDPNQTDGFGKSVLGTVGWKYQEDGKLVLTLPEVHQKDKSVVEAALTGVGVAVE